MTLFHIDRLKYQDIWPPKGTLFAEGRWNRAGQWIVYTSPTIALAKLETLANDNYLPIKRVCMTIEVDQNAGILEVHHDDLPDQWYKKPAPRMLQSFTAKFLVSDSLLMKVPSAQSYRESNYLINAVHPNFQDLVKLINISPEPFDPRLKG